MRIALAVTLAALATFADTAPPVYQIDPARSLAQFTITKLGFSDVVGTFAESSGEIRWDPSHPEQSSIRWVVRVASLRTDDRNRDQRIQGHDYFDTARHPEMTFVSASARPMPDGRLEVTGTLTIKGISRQQTVFVRHSGSAAAPVFETDFEINRYDFGFTGGTVMGRLLGRTVRIHLKVATKEHTS